MTLRIWLLTNVPSPYQVDLMAAVAESSDVHVHVRYMRGDESQLRRQLFPGGSTVRVMLGIGPHSWRDEVRLHPGALWECAVGRFDCYVLSGLWTSITLLACAALLTLRCKPWILWLERPRSDWNGARWMLSSRMPASLLWSRNCIRRALLRRARSVLCIGSAARDAYAALGVPTEKLFVLPYCCDTARFEDVDPQRVGEVRRRYNLDGQTVLLFSGQMIERKGVDMLIEVFSRIARLRRNVALLLLGDGPRLADYERLVPADLRSRVSFAGWIRQAALPEHFAAASIFVFPSRHDGWGVVISEACAAGLPVVTTRQTGAAYDLVEDGRSGFIAERDDPDTFVDRLLPLIDDEDLRQRYGRRSQELVAPFSAANGAAKFIEYVREVLQWEKADSARAAATCSS